MPMAVFRSLFIWATISASVLLATLKVSSSVSKGSVMSGASRQFRTM